MSATDAGRSERTCPRRCLAPETRNFATRPFVERKANGLIQRMLPQPP